MKQAEDNRTKDAFELPTIERLRQIENIIMEKAQKIWELEREIRLLEEKGTVNASLHYRAGRYLYLIHHTDENGDRIRQYVGAQPEKIKEAQDSVNRYHEAQELKRILNTHKNKIIKTDYMLDDITRTLKQNW